MCVIAYKPLNVAFPEERILKNCFENNDDGAGFMYAYKGKVYWQKGYESFPDFMEALNKARAITGDKAPYVMHFRIATQGYAKTMTHPFPLSAKMKDLKQLQGECEIGVAHNGILDITSDGSKAYSDTMKFITDYLSVIIYGENWYKNKKTKKLIEYLITGSRLAILDAKGHCELMGKGWVKDGDMYYSNSSYAREPYNYAGFRGKGHWNDDWWDDARYVLTPQQYAKARADTRRTLHSSGTVSNAKADSTGRPSSAPQPVKSSGIDWEYYRDAFTKKYYFSESWCPKSEDNLDTYCKDCANCWCCSRCEVSKVIELMDKEAKA